MKPFIITEEEKNKILHQHIEATSRQYLPESKHETEEIYTMRDKKTPSTGYSDMDMKDFDEFEHDLGFDAPSIVDIKRLKKLDKSAVKNMFKKRPKFTGSEVELDEEMDSYSIPQMKRDLIDATGISQEELDAILSGDEDALEEAKVTYGYTDEGRVRFGILDKLDFLFDAHNPTDYIEYDDY